MKRILILFSSTYDALAGEDRWPQSGYSGKLRPIPRVLSSSCGLCLETDIPDDVNPLPILSECRLEWEQVVEVIDKDLKVLAVNSQ